MPKRILAIGVGGSGKTILTLLKERLEETYGQTPDNVVLLSLDTDDLRDIDTFASARLNPFFDGRGREPEFQHVVSPPGMTMSTVIADINSGRTAPYMYWLEKDKLDRILGPAERDIRGGAQQRRPVGRVSLFLRWANPIYQSIVTAISRVYGEPETEPAVDRILLEQSKRLVFIVGSVAGGTGSGFLVDVANLVRHAVQSNANWQSVDVSAIIVLPDAFRAYTTVMDDPTNLKPNSYAALRELDRFIRTHSAALPYMIRYGDDIRSITWSINQPVDHTYLVDTASRGAMGDLDLSGDPLRGVFPVVADFIMAHVDQSLGNALATLRSNAGQHYDKEEGWQYSSFNILTYIFPVNDVIKSFSFRFLQELLIHQFLPISNKKMTAQVEQEATIETERVFSENSVGGKINPGVIQKAIAVTRRIDAEQPDVSWPGLFNMIALSESTFAQDYQNLEGWLSHLSGNLRASKEGEHKQESYSDGYNRLLNFSEHFTDECLGPQIDRDDEENRLGGEWGKILDRYRQALRQRFAEALDTALLDTLNRRDPQTKILLPARLPSAIFMVKMLKSRLVHFRKVLEQEYRRLNIDTRLRQTSEELRNAIAWMQETRGTKTFALFGKPEARKAQDAYIGLFYEKMELTLHQRIYRTVIDVLDALGAAEKDRDENDSILDRIALELENWQATIQEVGQILEKEARIHEKHREEKRQIKIRRYLTNPEFEGQLYQQPEYSGEVGRYILGQVRGEKGMTWQRKDQAEALAYQLITLWTEEAKGPEEIVHKFLIGVQHLFQEVIRGHMTIADRVAAEFTSSASFVNTASQVNEPFLRYNPASNGKQMFHERYVSFNLAKASDEARRFLEQARSTLGGQGVNLDAAAESMVACTVVEVARGVRLSAVDQFVACESDYRAKLYKGREALHLFPEEQVATIYENGIETLGEPNNRQRSLSPELMVTMGDEAKLRAFTMACAYGLIKDGTFEDPETGERSTEIFLTWPHSSSKRRLRLSQSRLVRGLDNSFDRVSAEEQLARLYLNTLQNFTLMATDKRGVPAPMVASLVEELKRHGVSLDHIENPFTLKIREVNDEIGHVIEALGPSSEEESNDRLREAKNARRCVEDYLQPFLSNKVASFKRSPAQRIKDMGTVMHLILQSEISRLLEQSPGVRR